jgi:O-antigen/teichoic acid export membrane protein/GT2 family glycosyltransferase
MPDSVSVQRGPHAKAIQVSVIVPSWSGEIAALRATLEAQTYQDYELIVVNGAAPAGRARNLGVVHAHGEYLLFIDDDATLGNEHVIETLLATLAADSAIGVVGPSKALGPDATGWQRRVARDVPRWVYPIVAENTESNPPLNQYGFSGITTTCCMLPRALFDEVGGFDGQLVSGEDPEFFYRVRQAGYRFMIPGACWVNHNPPLRLADLLRKSFRYGIGHAGEARKNPERRMEVLPLSRWYGKASLLLLPLLWLPLLFVQISIDPIRSWKIGFHPLKMLTAYMTLLGYIVGWFRKPDRGEHTITTDTVSIPPPAPNLSASRSSMLSGLTFLSVAILNNIYAILMASLLPIHEYGILGLAQSWLLIVATLLGSGFPVELARVLASSTSLLEAYRTAKSTFVGNLGVALACCGVLAIAIATGGLSFTAGTTVAWWLGAETLLLAFVASWCGVLQGHLRFGALGLSRFLEALIKVAGGATLILLGAGVEGAIGATVAGTIASLLLLVWGARTFPFWRETSWADWRTFQRSLTIFVGICALTIMGNIDIIGIKLFSPPQQADALAGYYQAAVVLARIPLLLAGAYAGALFPYISRARGQELSIYLVHAMKYALLLIVPLNLILIAIPDAAIELIFPPSYLVSAMPLRIAATGTLVLVLTTMFATMLQARGLARLPARWLPVAAVLEVAALWALVPAYGIAGAAAALLLASVVACVVLAVASAHLYPWRVGARNVIGYLAASAALMLLLMVFPHFNVAWTMLSSCMALAIYIVILAFAGLLRRADFVTLTTGLPLERIPVASATREQLLRAVDWLNALRPQHASDQRI